MRRGEIWWADLEPPIGTRPVLLVSRDEAYRVRKLVTVALLTTQIRNLPSEVTVGRRERVPKDSAISLDNLATVRKSVLRQRIAALSASKMLAVEKAIHFSLGLTS